jgi:hypothetical protein
MRIAEICPNCNTYIDASCIIYNGDYLLSTNIEPLTSLDEIIETISNTFPALTGEGDPTTIPAFIGQLYIDTDTDELWIGMGTSSVNWGLLAEISTTSTSTTTSA